MDEQDDCTNVAVHRRLCPRPPDDPDSEDCPGERQRDGIIQICQD